MKVYLEVGHSKHAKSSFSTEKKICMLELHHETCVYFTVEFKKVRSPGGAGLEHFFYDWRN